ncbi:hypothetical protein Sjap_001910 [Stephania japonica]|uniref:Translin-associated protein X n=1 Tax=Stephania japonica TaxID=461633 RepID=A0AAP0KLR5_9MAGN
MKTSFGKSTVAAEAYLLSNPTKKSRRMSTSVAMSATFDKYAHYPNTLNDKRERIVKASRDININSKKVIFQVHRISKYNRDEVLEKAETDLAAVTDQHLSRLVKELQGTNFGSLDALILLGDKNMLKLRHFTSFVADLTGELMRLAIGRISDGELEYAETICRFVHEIYRKLTLVVPIMDENYEMKRKMDTMLQSIVKIENTCFSVHVRESEYIPLLGCSDPNFSFLGAQELEL